VPTGSSAKPPGWKLASDIVGAVIGLVLLAVPMLVIAVAILVDSGRPILMRQRRIGVDGEEFLMWKFRTLPVGTPQLAKAELLKRGVITTRVGGPLRRYSLDEIPQLLNVLTGDMSLIGPRPALYTQDDLVAMRRAKGVLRVRPGLTGLAQVHGRENLPLEEKVALDAEYVRSMSPLLDLRIVLRTFGAVLRARGSY
jgi:O-antigen biosynthesis protein WbqP